MVKGRREEGGEEEQMVAKSGVEMVKVERMELVWCQRRRGGASKERTENNYFYLQLSDESWSPLCKCSPNTKRCGRND